MIYYFLLFFHKFKKLQTPARSAQESGLKIEGEEEVEEKKEEAPCVGQVEESRKD